MTTETQLILYRHERDHPYAVSSIAYKELAARANELERELAENARIISEMEKGFIIESRTHEH